MPVGRCPGCALTGSLRRVHIHVLNCPEFSELFRSDPDRCLDPADEYIRFREEEDVPEERAARRDERLKERFAEMGRLQDAQTRRWQTPVDILD